MTKKSASTSGDKTPAVPFEKALERLQDIVENLESGEPSLEQSLALFEEGVRLSRGCNQRLDDAERRLELLVKKADGSTTREPLQDIGDDEARPDGDAD